MQTEHSGLKRHLKARHIRLMALGSAIGVGLFLGSASAIQIAGPSILLGYFIAGIVGFIVLRALGEMAVHEPVAGSFAAYANTYIGPLAGYMVGLGLLDLLAGSRHCGSDSSRDLYGYLVS